MGDGAAVNASGHKNHVWAQLANALNLLVGKSIIIDGDDVHDDSTRSKGSTLSALRAHLFDNAGHHHLEAAARAAGREIDICTYLIITLGRDDAVFVLESPTHQLLDFVNGVTGPHGDIFKGSLNGGRRLTTANQTVDTIHQLNQNSLGGCAPAVCSEDRPELTVLLHIFTNPPLGNLAIIVIITKSPSEHKEISKPQTL